MPKKSIWWGVLLCTLSGVTAQAAPALETQIQTLVLETLQEHHIPGALVVVVHQGKVTLADGFGVADLQTGRKVEANTPFRVGSVSKVFTWTALMQQVEQGKVNLDDDINLHLKGLSVPSTFKTPITVKHLLTHASGLDERELGGRMLASSPERVKPAREALRQALPRRVRPPGEVVAYCNYCAALGGHIVESLSGEPFDVYIEGHILTPLEMHSSSFQQVLPETASKGHVWQEKTFQQVPDHLLQLPAAGSLYSTAPDMARFMLFQLGYGPAVLGTDTRQGMQRAHHHYDPRLPGVGLGWFEGTFRGHRTVWHAGNVDGFGSWLTLVPETGSGVFIALNARTDETARLRLTGQILDSLLPARPVPLFRPVEGLPTPAFAHPYRSTRRSDTTVQKLEGVLGTAITGNRQGDRWVFSGPGRGFTDLNGQPRQWSQVAAGLLQDPRDGTLLAYRADSQGRVESFQTSAFPFIVYERVPWWDGGTFWQGVLVGGGLLMGLGGVLSRSGTSRFELLIRWTLASHLLVVACTLGWLLTDGLTDQVSWLFWLGGAAAGIAVVLSLLLVVQVLRSPGKARWMGLTFTLGAVMVSLFWVSTRVIGWQV